MRAVLAAALTAWPASRRRALGASVLDAAEASVADARRRGRRAFLMELAGEAGGLVASGIGLRATATRRGLAAAAGGALGDARYALRTLRRSPGFTAVAVTILALGVGANAAVLSLADAVLLDRPPYRAPEELVLIWNTVPDTPDRLAVAGPDVAVLRERVKALAGVAFLGRPVDGAVEAPGGDGAAAHVRLSAVTPDLFAILGVEAALGRTFAAGEGTDRPVEAGDPAAVSVAVLTHGAWGRLFGGDPGVVGRTVRLAGQPVEVVGVLPPSFGLRLPPAAGIATDVDVFLPLLVPLTAFHRDERRLDQDSDNSGAVVARRAPGASLDRVRAELDRVAAELRAEVPAYRAAGLGFVARPLHADATAHARPLLAALVVAAALVLLVTALDLAALVLARGVGRARELAVRSALGAGRRRLVRQLLVEAGVLLGFGCLAALVVAGGVIDVLGRAAPEALVGPGAPPLSPAAFGLAAAVAAGAVLAAALVPARRLAAARRPPPSEAPARRRLVVAQVAVSVALLVGAGLLLRTVAVLDDLRPGFEPRGALTFQVALRTPGAYPGPASRAAVMKELETRLIALPGVEAVGWVGVLPLAGGRWTQPYGLPGQPPEAWDANRADFRVASSGYFEALGARLLEGRAFTPAEDVEEDARVVVVDALLARRLAPDGGSAVGATLGVPVDGAPVAARVVGVVEHVRHETLEADGREAVYVPYRQEASRNVAVVVRTAGDPAALAPAVRAAVREVDPRIPVHGLRTLADYVADATAPRRFGLVLLASFAVLALGCAATGLYGIVAFDVGRRTRDLGVRLAVGARPAQVVAAVLGGGLRAAAAGLALGVVLAAGVTRALASLLVGVGAADPAAWSGALAVVAAVTLLACWVPATRASRLDPTAALRAE